MADQIHSFEIQAAELMTIRPDIPIILCTGFSEQTTEEYARKMGIRKFVLKPIVMNTLARTVLEALNFNQQN